MVALFAGSCVCSDNQTASHCVETSSLPFETAREWLHFNHTDLDAISTRPGSLDFSSRFPYEGETSLRWQYRAGEIFTWNCNEKNLGRAPTFYFTALEPRAVGLAPSVFRLEFLDAKGEVAGSANMPLMRRFWNRCIIRLSGCTNKSEVGIENLKGTIPPQVSAVRIIAPANRDGEVFFGGWILTREWIWRRDDISELDGFPKDQHVPMDSLPAVSVAECQAAENLEKKIKDGLVETRLKEINKPFEAILAEVKKLYSEMNLRRTPEGGMTGRNLVVEGMRRGSWCSNPTPAKYKIGASLHQPPKNIMRAYADLGYTRGHCQLMLDLAMLFHLAGDTSLRTELLGMYEMMFDYSQYTSGYPSVWFGGDGYVESLFLMSRELTASRRLDPALVRHIQRQTGYERIFLDRSVYNTIHPGDLGEDCDYTRLTSERILQLAILEADPRRRVYVLHVFSRWFSSIVLAWSPGVKGTFKPDGSINHHLGLQLGYANGALVTCSRVIYLLSRSPFAIAVQGHALLKDVLLKRRLFSRHCLDPMILSGKEDLRYTNQVWPEYYRLMALAGTPDGKYPIDAEMASAWLRLAGETGILEKPGSAATAKLFTDEGLSAEELPQGHITLGWSACAVHRHGDSLLALKGYSKYAYSRESGHNPTFITPYLGFGSIELLCPQDYHLQNSYYVHDNGIASSGFDWRRFAGTTAVLLPFDKLLWKGDWQHRSDQEFVGGLDDDSCGIFVLNLQGPSKIGLESFRARKSWFFFGNTIICLGTGIENKIGGAETVTTLFQDPSNVKNPAALLLADRALTGFPMERQIPLNGPFWLINRQSTGYYLFPGQDLKLRRSLQECPSGDSKKVTSGAFVTAWLSHGQAPHDASYRYLMRLDATTEGMEHLAATMATNQSPYQVLRQDGEVHAVRSIPDGCTSYAFFRGGVDMKEGILCSISRACLVSLRQTREGIFLSVADPDLNLSDKNKTAVDWGYSQESKVELVLEGNWKIECGSGVGIANSDGLRTSISITCIDGLTRSIRLMSQAKMGSGAK